VGGVANQLVLHDQGIWDAVSGVDDRARQQPQQHAVAWRTLLVDKGGEMIGRTRID